MLGSKKAGVLATLGVGEGFGCGVFWWVILLERRLFRDAKLSNAWSRDPNITSAGDVESGERCTFAFVVE